MNKMILAYNFSPERLAVLKLLCMMLRVQLKPVERTQLLQPVGSLAGVPGVAPVQEEYTGAEATQELILMCGFQRSDLDRLLAGIRKSKLQSVKLKAMLTPTNAQWSGLELLRELEQEHEFMTGKNVQ